MKKVVLLVLLVAGMLLNVEAKKPQYVYIVGDETAIVVDTAAMPNAVGWGDVLSEYIPSVELINRAFAGASSRAMMAGGEWGDIIGNAGRGSILLVCLGHHEYDETDVHKHSTLEEFENNLLTMVADAQKKGVRMVLLTPTTKRYYYDHEYYPRHGAYAEGVRRVAAQQHLPLIDLEAQTRAVVEEAGELGSGIFFADEENNDAVCLSNDGARMVATMIADAAKEQKIKGLYTK